MTIQVHPSSVVEPGAQFDDGVVIGPFCHIGHQVKLARDVHLISHVSVQGDTCIGKGTKIYPFASIGHAPQDLKYQNEPSRVDIGEHNTIREHSSIHRGTRGGRMVTSMGDNNLVMGDVHIAHDCEIANHVIIVQSAGIAGHVFIDDHAIVGGMSGIHQFVRVGKHAMIGQGSMVVNDVLPYTTVMGTRACLGGTNVVGMKRHGYNRDEIHAIRQALDTLFTDSRHFGDALAALQSSENHHSQTVAELLTFIGAGDSRRRYTGPGDAG